MTRRALSCDGTCVAGAVADAAPVIARAPAAPNAKAAFLDKAAFLRFRVEFRLACVMVEPPRQGFDQWTHGSFRALRRKPTRCRFGSIHTVFRNFAIRGYGLRQRRRGM